MVYDRRKDLIISGGENIYPYEIESIAKTHSDINDAVCVAQEDETWGQIPVLYYVSDDTIPEIELTKYLKTYLAKYKVPKAFIRLKVYRTLTGKLQRNKMINKGQ